MLEMLLPALPVAFAWSDPAVIPVTLASVLIAVAIIWWRQRRRPMASTPVAPDDDAPAASSPAAVADEAPVVEGPGALLLRFQALNKDFEQATKDLQRFHGTREVQLQGWQQLSADIIRRILPVLDNLEPYLEDPTSPATDVAQLAYGRLLTELVTIGVTQITPAPGEPFNARYHTSSPDSTGYPPYRIKSVVSPGYRFQPRIQGAGEMVLKPAEVVVESQPAEVLPLERAAAMTEEV